ncbi:MAG: hypothetical protein A2X64_01335 [Ignavibacteria bacterium GWF2_33_9]|nr:MAG: hypothetical protein A2X64_01335 [Ignavibacteria bacterium GWF2_33_9]
MSRIKKQFQTKYKADELKNWVSAELLPNPMLSQAINQAAWNGYDLFLDTKIGKGNIIIRDYLVDIDFELNFIGSMASKTIEDTLDQEFKKLESKK